MHKVCFKHVRWVILLLISGCSSVILNQQIVISDKDWLMAGGSALQQNISTSVLSPPLTLLWTYNCDAGIGNLALSAADAVLFVNTLQGEMFSFDISSGGRLGHLNFLGKEANTTPVINKNNIILAFAGDDKRSLLSYDVLDAAVTWRTNLGFLQTSPVLYDGFIYAGSLSGNEYKIKTEDGRIAWSYNVRSQIHSTCCATDKYVVFGADNGYLYCLNVDNGIEKWKFQTGGSIFSTPMYYNNMVFTGSYDSVYYCIDINNGSLIWKQNVGTKMLSGSALYDSTSVIFSGIDGDLYSLKIQDGSINWKFHTKGVITATPLVSGSNIYFSSFDQNLYCINGSDGKMLWNYELGGKSKTSPIIWDGFLFTADDNTVYCFSHSK
jgi:outer membrane protein assembly factor BamB